MSGQIGGSSPAPPEAEAAAAAVPGGAVLEAASPAWQPEQLAGLAALNDMSDNVTDAELAVPITVGWHPRDPGGLSRITRLELRLDRVVLKEEGGMEPSGAAVALFEVLPQDLEVRTHQLSTSIFLNASHCNASHARAHPVHDGPFAWCLFFLVHFFLAVAASNALLQMCSRNCSLRSCRGGRGAQPAQDMMLLLPCYDS
jgi:hypothetical protein